MILGSVGVGLSHLPEACCFGLYIGHNKTRVGALRQPQANTTAAYFRDTHPAAAESTPPPRPTVLDYLGVHTCTCIKMRLVWAKGETWERQLSSRGGSVVSDTRPAILEAVYMPLVSVGWQICMHIIPSSPPEKLSTLFACHAAFKRIEILVPSFL